MHMAGGSCTGGIEDDRGGDRDGGGDGDGGGGDGDGGNGDGDDGDGARGGGYGRGEGDGREDGNIGRGGGGGKGGGDGRGTNGEAVHVGRLGHTVETTSRAFVHKLPIKLFALPYTLATAAHIVSGPIN